MLGFAKKLFGSSNDRKVKAFQDHAQRINALEPKFAALSDDELRMMTDAFRDRLANGETLDKILPEAFAVVREASKRVLGMLEDVAENQKDKYAAFWKEFGAVLKEGVGEDHANQERLVKLLRFASTQADEGVSFADYIGRMKEGQEAIYYITADSLAGAKSSPQLEIFRKKGIEVLLLTDRVDEWMLSHLYEVEGKPLQSVAKGAVDLGKLQDEEEKKAAEEAAE